MLKLSLLLALSLAPASPALAQKDAPPIPADTEIVTTTSGLQYSVLVAGQGTRTPHPGEPVHVHYVGWLSDGTVFDSTRRNARPFDFVVGKKATTAGMDEAVQLMTKGAKFKITLPCALGYGEQGMPPTIPAKSTLIYEVELLDFVAYPEFQAARADAQKKTESGLVYEVLAEGEGNAPKRGENVKLKFALWTQDGKLVDCSEMKNVRLEGAVGNLQFPFSGQGLTFANEAAQLLKPGSRYRFEVPAALAFGMRGNGAGVPPNAATVWVLENPKLASGPTFSMTPPGRLKTTASGLGYEVLREGTGRTPRADQRIKVHYTGWLASGQSFDSSYERGEPSTFAVNEVVKGWAEGLMLMKEGAIYKLTIPSELAWGARGRPGIPPNAMVVFVVELIAVQD